MILSFLRLNFFARTFLKKVPSESGYLTNPLPIELYDFTAFGLGPNADSFAESFIGLRLLLNRLKPATYFSAIIFLGFGNLIIFLMSYIKRDSICIMEMNLFE